MQWSISSEIWSKVVVEGNFISYFFTFYRLPQKLSTFLIDQRNRSVMITETITLILLCKKWFLMEEGAHFWWIFLSTLAQKVKPFYPFSFPKGKELTCSFSPRNGILETFVQHCSPLAPRSALVGVTSRASESWPMKVSMLLRHWVRRDILFLLA